MKIALVARPDGTIDLRPESYECKDVKYFNIEATKVLQWRKAIQSYNNAQIEMQDVITGRDMR